MKKSRREMMTAWTEVSSSGVKQSDLNWNLKVKPQDWLVNWIQGLRKGEE